MPLECMKRTEIHRVTGIITGHWICLPNEMNNHVQVTLYRKLGETEVIVNTYLKLAIF